jgi:triosephosphate isomerase
MTGELSAEVFKEWGVRWTLTGHSERRRELVFAWRCVQVSLFYYIFFFFFLTIVSLFFFFFINIHYFLTTSTLISTGRQQTRQLGHDERAESVAKKTAHSLSVGLKVILCIGETLGDREAGNTLKVCFDQLSAVKNVISSEDWMNIVVAYEPVWAIGTGVSASPAQAQEVHAALRRWLLTNLNEEIAARTRIIYGGSVKPTNAKQLIACPDIDGFLVGGCSLKADFMDIIRSCPAEFDASARGTRLKRSASDIQSIGADGSKKSKQ